MPITYRHTDTAVFSNNRNHYICTGNQCICEGVIMVSLGNCEVAFSFIDPFPHKEILCYDNS